MSKNKFSLGQVYLTATVNNIIAENKQFSEEVTTTLNRYSNCDWGDLPINDKKLNDDAVINGNDRILASYKTSQGKLYIITEYDRTVTTILFADEY